MENDDIDDVDDFDTPGSANGSTASGQSTKASSNFGTDIDGPREKDISE